MQKRDPLASSNHNSTSRVSLENAKTKTWHAGWIILLLLVIASIATYATSRVLRHGIVSPARQAANSLEIPPEAPAASSP